MKVERYYENSFYIVIDLIKRYIEEGSIISIDRQ